MDTRVLSKQVASAAFSFYSADEVRALSVKRVTNSMAFDQLKQPVPNGLYDPAMGPVDKFSNCPTCALSQNECPGHFGHIELNVPCYQPVLFNTMFSLLRLKCFSCHRLRASDYSTRSTTVKLGLLEAGLVLEYLDLVESAAKAPASGKSQVHDDGDDGHMDAFEMADKKLRECEKKLAAMRASQSHFGGRDTSHVQHFRREVIREFMKAKDASGRCTHCKAYTPKLRKDASAKIFLLAYTEQAERAMQGMGLTLPNVLDSSSLMDRAAEEAAQIAASEARKSKKADKHKKKSKKSKHSKRKQHGSDSESESQSEEQSSEESESSSEDEEEEGEESHILAEKPPQKSKRELKAAAAEKKAAGGEDVDMTNSKSATRLLFANEVERHFELLWREEREVLSAVFNSSADGGSLCQRGVHLRQQDWRIFFLRVMGVPPNRFRPPVVLSELTFEHAQNHYYKKIIDANADIVQYSDKSRQQLATHATAAEVAEAAARRKSDLIRVTNAWLELQEAVNCLMDSAKNPNSAAAKSAPSGIKQELERKEGLFRMHMMGKRVNFAARSVISPDPYLHTNEIGIPRRFAMKLTYPQPVNAWNVAEMRQAVVNGPLEYPGANYVQDERGQLINLEALSRDQREALSKMLLTSGSSTAKTQASAGVAGRGGNSVVLRHLRTGDVLLANRQPTLHKPSMMAHKARVLYGEQTIRMHYANCKTYNADFDGDEINLHFPQNELARAELYTIANTDNQYIVPTSGKPIRGLIQDHVGAGVLLTSRDTFFTRHEFQQLLFCACIDANPRVAIRTPPPAILRPRPLWTGKQLFSAVLSFVCDNLPPLTMESGASVPADAWGGKDVGREEAVCTIVKNDLVCGIVDKNQYGASAFGVVHAVYELYGATKAGNLLSALGRLLTAYLQRRGFTCGMDDLVLAADADRNRQAAIAKSDSEGVKAAAKFAECDISAFTAALDDPSAHPELVDKCKRAVSVGLRKKLSQPANAAALDSVMRGALSPTTSTIIKKCLPGGQIKPFPWNCMSVMTLSGAKGSLVNFSQISCLLGQQELEGRRVPVMASGKSLPSFAAFDPSPRAGGYVTQRFLSGIRPQEFYFHCMAGREGLVDTAVKTARSGYLQRCLIKHLESLTVAYDYTVRDGDGSVVQFHYGEDSLDVCKSKYLDKFSFFAKNYQSLLHKLNPSAAISALDVQSVATYREENANNKKADPLLSVFSPTSCLGATSEKFDKAVQAYIAKNPENLIRASGNSSKLTADKFQALMSLNYLRAVVDPGEAVGCIAGQSVGEPSTQMTLNTFHLAGHGGRNVTLGIPRLREIVMTASAHISTPSMELKVKVDSGDLKEAAEALSRRLTRLRLSELVDFVSVRESVESSGETGDAKVRAYRLRLNFLPLSDPAFVISKHEVAFREVAAAVETSFVPKLVSFIARQLKKSSTNGAEGAAGVIQSQRVGRMGDGTAAKDSDDVDVEMDPSVGARKKSGVNDDDEDDDEADDTAEGDGDATEALQRSKKSEGRDYDDADDSDADELRKSGQRAEESSSSDSDSDDDKPAMVKVKFAKKGGDESDSEVDTKKKSKASSPASTKRKSVGQTEAQNSAARAGRLVSAHRYVRDAIFDDAGEGFVEVVLHVPVQSKKMLLVSAAEAIGKLVFVRATKGIEKCFVETKDNGPVKEYVVTTDGVNFAAAWQHADRIDVNSIDSNDIAAILRTYGVEAARASIMNQVSAVFNAYGIGVDARHLSLISDYMTFQGGFKPMNRMGMEANTSPWLKMSFETCMHFLSSACEFGDIDTLKSPAARLVVGKPVGSGTGSFELLYPLASK